MNRRDFLIRTTALGTIATLNQVAMLSARAANSEPYKALVCVFLFGGNDGNNTVIPYSAGYGGYAGIRSTLALPQESLVPLPLASGVAPFALHPDLAPLASIWNAGNLAVLFNVGTLSSPITKDQYLAHSVPRPENLMSHADQQQQWMSGIYQGRSRSGWGGRLSEALGVSAGAGLPSVISIAGNPLFTTGQASQPLSLPASGTIGLAATGARRDALLNLFGLDRGNAVFDAAANSFASAVQYGDLVKPILSGASPTIGPLFDSAAHPELNTGIARQFMQVARLIEARVSLGGARQIFFVSLGGFDTHTNQLTTQRQLFAQLAPALKAFYDATIALGVAQNVATFTLSDFGRTLKPASGGGSDHAWGSHHFVFGGTVKGGLYGTFPQLALGGPDDFSDEGRWVPTIAVDQYAATLASWFDLSSSALASVLPSLSNFPTKNLGFMF